MANLDPFNISPSVRETPIAGPPAPTKQQVEQAVVPPQGPTGFWGRITTVGVNRVNILNAYRAVAHSGPTVQSNPLSQDKQLAKTAGKTTVTAGETVGKTLAQPFGDVAKTAAVVSGGAKIMNDASKKASDALSATLQKTTSDYKAGKISKDVYQQHTAQLNQAMQKVQKMTTANTKTITDNTSAKRTAGDVLQIASLAIGGGETASLLKGGTAGLAKGLAVNAAAGAVGNTGSTLSNKPNASAKELAKSGAEGAAIGAGTAIVGSTAGKVGGAVKTVLGKDKAVKADLKNVATNQLVKKGGAANAIEVPKTTQKLLTAGDKQSVKGKGFVMSDKIDQAAEVTKPAAEASLSVTPTKPPKSESPHAPLVNTNKPAAKGLGGLVSKAADKLHISGKVNPEQALLNKGHTDAAQAVREISANRDLANYRGERAKAIFDKNASKSEQNYETFAAQRETNASNSAAHQHFASTLQDTGQRGVKAGTLESARDTTYTPRYTKFNDTTKSAGIGGLQKTGGFSKGRVQAGEFGLGGDKYATYGEFKNAVTAGGGKTSSATTGEVLGHTVASREKAIANANGLSKLETKTMADGKPAITTIKPGSSLSQELSGYDTSILPGRAVHPDLVPAIKSFVEGSGKSNILSKVNTLTKRLVTVNGAIHDLNYARSSIGEQGLLKTVKGFHPTDIVQKGLDNPAYHADTERMIKNGMVTSRTGLTNIFDEPSSMINRKVTGALGKLRGKMDQVTFGIGDNLGRSTYLKIEKGLMGKGLSAKEAGQTAAEAANRVMFTQREGQQSAEAKSVGRVALFAKNFFQSTIQKATTAAGISKNTALSRDAQRAGQVQAAKGLAKSFAYLFGAAQAINYHATGHSTFQNKDSKISPVFYVDKTTGKQYHITNWYGQVGELIHLAGLQPSAITNKVSPGLQELARIVSNKDQLGYSGGGNVRDTNASGVKQWGQMLANSLEHLVTPAGIDSTKAGQIFGKGGQPGKVSAANLFGLGTSTSDNNGLEKDVLSRYYATLPSGTSKTPPATTALEAAARNDLSKGNKDTSNIKQLQSQMTPTQFKTFMKTGADNPTQRAFDKLPNDQKMQIIEKYSPEQLKELDLTGVAKSLVSSSAKTTITSLQAKGYSTQRIQQDLQKIGIDSAQLQSIKAEAKKQAAIQAKKSRAVPKFVNPLVR